MKFERVEKVDGLPIELSFIKDHLRVTGDDEDGLIGTYANAAVDVIYHETWHLLKRYEYTFFADDWEDMKIPIYPVVSIDSVKYYNENEVLATMPVSDYYYDIKECPSVIVFDDSPDLQDERFNTIEVKVAAGYESRHTIPDGLISAFLLIVADFYENRQSVNDRKQYEIPRTVKHLLNLQTKQLFV